MFLACLWLHGGDSVEIHRSGMQQIRQKLLQKDHTGLKMSHLLDVAM